MRFDVVVGAVAVTAGLACSTVKLSATPTSPQDRATVGLRYYLPLPYVHVKKPVLLGRTRKVTETVATTTAAQAVPPKKDARKAAAADAAPPLGANANDTAGTTEGAPVEEKAKEQSAATAAEDGVEVIMLPDFCQQQALTIDAHVSKLDVELTLKDGWRLEAVKSSMDTTAAMTSSVDLVKTTLGAAKDIIGAIYGKPPADDEEEGGSEPQSAFKGTSSKSTKKSEVKETWLRPGFYPLFKRDTKECSAALAFDAQWWSNATFERSIERSTDSSSETR